jgi:hypothetical protein
VDSSARIFLEIRTKQGLAYSIGSFYKANSDYGLFDAYALTKPESTVKVTTGSETSSKLPLDPKHPPGDGRKTGSLMRFGKGEEGNSEQFHFFLHACGADLLPETDDRIGRSIG